MVKKESTEWKQDTARAERKERLAQMKGSDGQKRKIQSRSIWKKVTLITTAVVLVLALSVWLIASTGLLTRYSKALTVNGRKVTAAEANIHFGNYTASQQWGLAFTEKFQATLDQQSQVNPANKLRDDLVNSVIPSIVYSTAILTDLEKNDFKLTEEQQKIIDTTLESLETQLTQMALQQGTTLAGFLKMYFGPGVNMKLIKNDFVNSMKISYYNDFLAEKADVSGEKIKAYYEENKDDLDLYTYNYYEFKLSLKDDATAAEKKAALEKLKADASATLEDLGHSSFVEAVKKHVSEEEAEKLTKDPGSVDKKEAAGSGLTGETGKFLKDSERRNGDAKVIEGSDKMTLIRFQSRDRNESRPFYSVRHILIANEKDAETPKTDEVLKAEAEKVLAEYNAGEKTEKSFGELAAKYSKDPGSAEKGGLYADMDQAFQQRLAPEFRAWFQDTPRKPGDTGIIKTSFGYHIMYFVEHSEEKAEDRAIKDTLKKQFVKEWSDKVYKEATVERHPFGMKFVGKLHFFDALLGKAPVKTEDIPDVTNPTK